MGASTVKGFFQLLQCRSFTALQKNIPGGESGSRKHESALRTGELAKHQSALEPCHALKPFLLS